MTSWICRRWVGEHPMPVEEEIEGWGLAEVMNLWQEVVDVPEFRIHHYAVFVEWLRRTFGEKDGEFYWRYIHKIREERIPSVKRLILWWGWESLKRTLIRVCLERWAAWSGTPRPTE